MLHFSEVNVIHLCMHFRLQFGFLMMNVSMSRYFIKIGRYNKNRRINKYISSSIRIIKRATITGNKPGNSYLYNASKHEQSTSPWKPLNNKFKPASILTYYLNCTLLSRCKIIFSILCVFRIINWMWIYDFSIL